jgi:hypothetical protein
MAFVLDFRASFVSSTFSIDFVMRPLLSSGSRGLLGHHHQESTAGVPLLSLRRTRHSKIKKTSTHVPLLGKTRAIAEARAD